MADAFSAAVDTLFTNADLSTSGVYTPAGGAPQAVRVLKRIPQTMDISFGSSRVSTSGILLTLRVSEVPIEPARGDALVVDGVTYNIESVKSVARNLQWALDATPQ
jgi:hypothetical protein